MISAGESEAEIVHIYLIPRCRAHGHDMIGWLMDKAEQDVMFSEMTHERCHSEARRTFAKVVEAIVIVIIS